MTINILPGFILGVTCTVLFGCYTGAIIGAAVILSTEIGRMMQGNLDINGAMHGMAGLFFGIIITLSIFLNADSLYISPLEHDIIFKINPEEGIIFGRNVEVDWREHGH